MLYDLLSKRGMESLRTVLSLIPQPIQIIDNLCLLSVSVFELVDAGEVSLKVRSWDYYKGRHETISTSSH